jgi:predicted transcriptional regulator
MARLRSVCRAELVRQAIAEYVETNTTRTKSAIDDAFGAWGEDFEDGLVYQERLRSEWER